MKKLACLIALIVCLVAWSGGQSLDLALGGGSAGGGRLNGGFWPSASATAMFSPHVGVNAEFSVRSSTRTTLAGQFRPSTMDINLVMRFPPMHWTPEVLAGYAAVRTAPRVGNDCLGPLPGGGFGPAPCLGDPSRRLSAFHLGGEVKTYFAPRWFVRFEANWFARPAGSEFGFSALRVGAAIGYTFGKR
jgi:hypothetical protein